VLSLILLAIAVGAYYLFHLAGAWRWVYVVTAMTALYFNCFVLVFQGFLKVGVLHDLAPTQSEPPFAIAQVAVMAIFIVLGIGAVRKFHPVRGLRHRRASLRFRCRCRRSSTIATTSAAPPRVRRWLWLFRAPLGREVR